MNDHLPTIHALGYATPRRRSCWAALAAGWQRWRSDAMFVVSTAWLGCVMFAGVCVSTHSNKDETPIALSLYAIFASAALTAVAVRGRSGGRSLRFGTRFTCGLVAAIAFAGMFGIQSCPHATYVRVGPLVISIAGRACHNTQPSFFWPAMMSGSAR